MTRVAPSVSVSQEVTTLTSELLQEGETYQLQDDSLRLTVDRLSNGTATVTFEDGTTKQYDTDVLADRVRDGRLMII